MTERELVQPDDSARLRPVDRILKKRRQEQRALVTSWLGGDIGPGGPIIADIDGVAGPGPGWDVGPGIGVLAGLVLAWQDLYAKQLLNPAALAAIDIGCLLLAVFSLALIYRRKVLYLAVTSTDLIVVAMNRRGREPIRLLARTPLAEVQIAAKPASRARLITCARLDGLQLLAAGARQAIIRPRLDGRLRRDQEFLATAAAGGALVSTPAAARIGA